MTRFVTLRVIVPVDDGVKAEQLQTFLRELLRGQPNATVPLGTASDGTLLQPGHGTLAPIPDGLTVRQFPVGGVT